MAATHQVPTLTTPLPRGSHPHRSETVEHTCSTGAQGDAPSAPKDCRYAWACIFGAICPARATGAALVMPYANTDAMSAHLAEIGRHVSPGAHAILVLDGAGWHSSRDLAVPANITLLTLPPYSPELNPVENIWQFLRQNRLANRVFDSYETIVAACCEAWNVRVPRDRGRRFRGMVGACSS